MSDNKKTISCPACNNEMVKVFDKAKGINIDICLNGCGGIFFDNRELEKFDEAHENADEILNAIKGKSFKKADESETRICPICNVPMVKMGAGTGDVEIDICNTCGAKFLDNGELEKIRSGSKADLNRIDTITNLLYQEDLERVLGKQAHKDIKSSPRRQYFENLVISFLNK